MTKQLIKIFITVVVISVLVIMACSCSPKEETVDISQPPENTSTQNNSNTSTGVSNNNSSEVGTNDWQQEQIQGAQDLMRRGRVEEAILMLETMAEEQPDISDITGDLVESHSMYAERVQLLDSVNPLLANQVLFMHYTRILELDPENEAATEGMAGVMAFFEESGAEVPEELDFTMFIEPVTLGEDLQTGLTPDGL